MNIVDKVIDRRTFMAAAGTLAAAAALDPFTLLAKTRTPIRRPIPSTGEPLAVVGMGTWDTFDVGSDPEVRRRLTGVLQAFFTHGGSLIDSSPMYGRSARRKRGSCRLPPTGASPP